MKMVRSVLVVLLLLFSGQAETKTETETLHIFADFRAQPKNWVDKEGNPQGIFIEILKEVTARTGIQFTYSFGPWRRALAGSQNGEGAIISFSKTTEREKDWDYSIPFFFDELIFVTTKNKAFNFTGLNNMAGRRIAIKRGATYGDDFDQAIEQKYIEIIETTDRAGQMQMLKRDRVDAVLMSPGKLSLETIIAETDWLKARREDFVVVNPPYKVDPNYLGIPKSMNKAHLLTPINRAVSEMFNDGTHQAIIDRVTAKLISELAKKRK